MRRIINKLYDVEINFASTKGILVGDIVKLISSETYKKYADKNKLSVSIVTVNGDGELIYLCVNNVAKISDFEFTAYSLTKNQSVSSNDISFEDLIKISGSLIGQIDKIPYKGTNIDTLKKHVSRDYIFYSDVTMGQFLEGLSFPDLTEEEISELSEYLELWDNDDVVEINDCEYDAIQKCLECGHRFRISESEVDEDELGIYTECPKCYSSFNIA